MVDIFKEKPIFVLISLSKHKKLNINQLSELSNMAYAHCRTLVNSFVLKGFIVLKRLNGREVELSLTVEGLNVVKLINKLLLELHLEVIEKKIEGINREISYLTFFEKPLTKGGETDGSE